MGSQLTADFEILATSRPVIEEVIEKLKLKYSYDELVEMIQTDNQSDTRILRFTVIDENAKEAKAIANELAEVTAERVAYVMSSDKPKIVEEAVVPKKASSPNTMKNTIIGALAVAFLAIGIIVIKYLVNDTVQNEDDIKNILTSYACSDSDRKEEIDLKDRTRKIIVAVLLGIAVCCAGYLIWYYATAAKTKQSYDDAKSWQRKM